MSDGITASRFGFFEAALRFRRFFEDLAGWRRWGVAFLLGIFAALAMPPWNGLFFLLLSLPGLFWLVSTAPNHRTAFLLGLAFGFGHFFIGIYWITNALLVDADRFAWLVPIVIPGLALYLALFPAGSVLTLRLLGRFFGTSGWRAAFLFALLWVIFEWLRGHLLTGFPWILMGHGWIVSDAMIQTAALIGSYGLSFVMVLVALMPIVLVQEKNAARLLPLLLMSLLIVLLWGAGTIRLFQAEAQNKTGIQLRIVQANIPQANKWRSDLREAHFEHHLALTMGASLEKPNIIIWPEMAVPYILSDDPERRARIRLAIPVGGLLLTGAARLTKSIKNKRPMPSNGLVALNDNGEIVGGYDKFHLVPFGEYMPLRKWLPLSRVVPGIGDFHRGPGPRTLLLPGLPALSPLICYEAIFPGRVLDTMERPRWLLNVTNDAWFGESSGPHQHFTSARFRAVEEGLPLIRAANTGISAIVDAYGRVRSSLDLGVEGVLDGSLPPALEPTPYAKLQDGTLLGLLVAGFVLLGLARIRCISTKT